MEARQLLRIKYPKGTDAYYLAAQLLKDVSSDTVQTHYKKIKRRGGPASNSKKHYWYYVVRASLQTRGSLGDLPDADRLLNDVISDLVKDDFNFLGTLLTEDLLAIRACNVADQHHLTHSNRGN
jgi:hypothetical protein